MARNNDALLIAGLLALTGSRQSPSAVAASAQLIGQDAKDARELRQLMNELENRIRADLPGLSKEAVQRTAEMTFGATIALGKDCVSEAMLADAVDKLTEVLVAAKVKWAVELIQAAYDAKFKPAYDNAVKAGVDPVVVFQANFQMTKANAQKMVDAIRKNETSGTSLTKEK